jgi:methylglyoxal synthase
MINCNIHLNDDRIMSATKRKTIALVAHDHKKQDLVNWVKQHHKTLIQHQLVCTGTTGKLVEQTLLTQPQISAKQLAIHKLKSGPLGGDQQLGAMICEGKVDVLFFFWDPMEPHPHDVDVKALLRIAVVYNIPIACNRSSADYLISSPLIHQDYAIQTDDYSGYIERQLS